jgi:hypothetical protein
MGHRTNVWIQRSLVPAGVVATFVMRHLGFGVWRTLIILLPIFALLVILMLVAEPGPRAKGFVEGLKSRFR